MHCEGCRGQGFTNAGHDRTGRKDYRRTGWLRRRTADSSSAIAGYRFPADIIGEAIRATTQQANEIVRLAREYAADVRSDPGHRSKDNRWTLPHLNVGAEGQAHVPVLAGYVMP